MKDVKIMVVDDERKNHMIMEGILGDAYELVSVFSGEECLEKIEEEMPNLVLLDVMMPGKDGYEVCESIKGNISTAAIPIMFVSAKDSLEDRIKGYEVGAVDYFVKPFDHDELLAKVKRILDYQKIADDLKKNVAAVSQVAMQAMSTSSELGAILRFLQNSFAITSFDALCESLFELLREGGMNAAVQVRTENEVVNRADNAAVSPLEATILLQASTKGRIIDVKHRTIFNHDHVSIMIKNMPLDNEIRYGQIKDNLCYVLDGMEARICGLIAEQEALQTNENLLELIGFINSLVAHLNGELYQIRVSGAGIIEDMKERIDRLIPSLGLGESHESSLEKITDDAASQSFDLFDKGLRLDENMKIALSQLQDMTQNKRMDSKTVEAILRSIHGPN